MKNIIRKILKEESLKQSLKDKVKEWGWEDVVKMIGDPKSLAELAFNNDPLEFLNMFNNFDVVQSEDRRNWTLYRYGIRNNLMIYDRKNQNVYIRYNNVWSFLKKGFGLKYPQIRELTKKWLGQTFDLKNITTNKGCEFFENDCWLIETI